ncbi:MAG: hypothetical protein OEV44_13240 [Spirochaetota bacterium]|nr:hypothetical protein [Spirochaetota bacterium]
MSKDFVEKNNLMFILIGYYLPVVGWMLPLYLKANSPDCQFHAKQAFVIGRLFLLLLGILWIVGNFVPVYLDFLLVIMLTILLVSYYLLLVVAGLLAYFKNGALPYFGKQVNKVKL